MTASPLLFDRDLHRIRLDRAAADYARADFLKRRVAQDVVMRLETILRRFPVAVDLGARNGAFSQALADSDAAEKIDVLFQTDLPDRLLAAEIVREKIYAQTREEVPYGASVETEKWEERRDQSVAIHAVVYAARPGQKAILVGKQGARIKAIGAAARIELEKLLERRVHLFLRVLLRERWDEERERLSALGLDDPG